MRIGMWMGAPLRALGVVAVLALAACGGGSSDEKPALGVSVTVDGVADSAGPLTAGETSTVEVASGATLVFASEGETRWDPTATDSTYTVNDFTFTSKSMTVSSNAGGTVVVVFTNKADPSQTATLNVTVAPKEFQAVARVDGEVESWTTTWTDSAGVETHVDQLRKTELLENGGYGIDFADPATGAYSGLLSLYDAEDRYLGFMRPAPAGDCLYDHPVALVSYPMHVGKSWSGDATRDCGGSFIFSQHYSRSIEAFGRIVVPQGRHDALRIKSEVHYSVTSTDPLTPSYGYTVASTCWWAVDLGRSVRCDYVTQFDGEQSSDRQSAVLSSLTR